MFLFFTTVAPIYVELHDFLYAPYATLHYCSADDGEFTFLTKAAFFGLYC